MKRILHVIAVFMAASISYADFSGLPDDIRENLPAIQKYSKAPSILLSCSELYTLNADGSQVYEWHSFRYFPDEAARDAYGDPRVNYAEGRQTIDVLRARTYTSDGLQIDCTPENAFNPVVADEMDLAPDFGEYRQLVITLLGLENGSISELHYRITTPKPFIPWLEGRVYFRDEAPVLSHELTIQIPEGTTLSFKCDRGAQFPSNSGNKYVWKVGEQAGYLAEDLSGHRELLPNVEFTTAQNWEVVCDALTNRINAASSEAFALPKSLRDAVAGIGTVDGRVNAIKNWVKERFRKIHFEHPEFKLNLRSANQILNSGYGNGFELALLVKSLAAEMGIKSEILPRFSTPPAVASLLDWADPVLAFHPDFGGTCITDPLAPKSETRAEFAASTIYDLATCGVREPSFRSSATPHFNLWLNLIDLEKDTVLGHGSLITSGAWGTAELIQDNGAVEFLNNLVTLPGFECTNSIIRELSERRVSVDFDFTMATLDTADNYRILSLSAMDFSQMFRDAPWKMPSREFPQAIPLVGEVALHLEAALPETWELHRKPGNSSETWDWSTGDVTCKVEDGRLLYDRQLNLVREWIAPSGWSGLRSWIIESGPRPNHCAVLEAK